MAIKTQRHEELLRSSFLPSDVLGGTALGLFYNNETEQYLVRTRFQTHYVTKMGQDQGRALGKAIEVFEDMIAGVMPRQKRASSENTLANLEHRVARLEREASSPALNRGGGSGFQINVDVQSQISDMLDEEPMLSKTMSRGRFDMIEATLEDGSVHYFICDRRNVLKHFTSEARAYKEFR